MYDFLPLLPFVLLTESERYYVESHYYHFVTGDLERARRVYELWAQVYPRDALPWGNLGFMYLNLGQYDLALAQTRETLRLNPASALPYAELSHVYLDLNRLDEAQATADEAQTKKLDSPVLRFNLYQLAFLRNDVAGMAQQVVWASGKLGVEDVLVGAEADTAAYFGRLGKAREFSRQAGASAERAKEKETAAVYEAQDALREALFGDAAEARHAAAAALQFSNGRDVHYGVALALALVGDVGRAGALVEDLAKRFPEDTLVRFNYLPTIHSQLALRAGRPNAVEILLAAVPYELGDVGFNLYSVHMRGQAYLAAHRGTEAAAEFQKILDHNGVVFNGPIGALAHLGLARAYAVQRDTAKARTKYQDFLTLWKDADPDTPILKQAKAEYAKLQ